MQQLQLTLNRGQDIRTDLPKGDPDKPVRKISEERRAYLRRYYEANKEKAREYQRRYNLTHKKKVRLAGRLAGAGRVRQEVRETFHASDIMRSPTEKSMQIIQLILKGERHFTI